MYDHLILVTREYMIRSGITNLIYTEVRVRASKQDNTYIQNEDDYEPLVERQLNDKQIANFKALIQGCRRERTRNYLSVRHRLQEDVLEIVS